MTELQRLAAVEAVRDNQYTQAVEATQRALLAEVERDRLKAALQEVYDAFRAAGLDNSYTYADGLASDALSREGEK